MLTSPIAITNTHSVGVVRDALVAAAVDAAGHGPRSEAWSLPVVGETYDGLLNDMNGFHVRAEHVAAALASATGGPVAEGGVGGGTGSVCHEFKGGIGTASRVIPAELGGHTVGVLVQANYGKRDWLRVDGVPVGAAIGTDRGPRPVRGREGPGPIDPAAGLGLDHRRRRDRRAAAPPPVPAAGPATRARHRAGRRDGRAYERRPVHRASRPAIACRPGIDDKSPHRLRRPRRRRPGHRRAVRRASSRRPRKRSSTRSSRRRRWSDATGSPRTPCRTIGCSRRWPATAAGRSPPDRAGRARGGSAVSRRAGSGP